MLSALHPLAPLSMPVDRQTPPPSLNTRHPDVFQQTLRPNAGSPAPLPLFLTHGFAAVNATTAAAPARPPVSVSRPSPADPARATPPQSPSTELPSKMQPVPVEGVPADLSPAAMTTGTAAAAAPPPPMDPRLMAMATRIAGYYQQRCQAITTAQQQRCQVWANLQRRKTHEMMQSAMLVVAWYVRDRIQRKRRHLRRAFRSGLKVAQASRVRLTNSELVKRWAACIPEGCLESPHVMTPEEVRDREEANFDVETRVRSAAREKETKILDVAERMVRSQAKKAVEVPIFGTVSHEDLGFDSDMDSNFAEDEEKEKQLQFQQAMAAAGDYRRVQKGVQELELEEEEDHEDNEELEEEDDDEDDELEDYEDEDGDDEDAEGSIDDDAAAHFSNEVFLGSGSPAAGTGSPRLEN